MLPEPVASLLAVVTQPGYRPQAGPDLETFIAPGGCLDCGGHVAYPFDGTLWFNGYCKTCGQLDLVTRSGGFTHRWRKRA